MSLWSKRCTVPGVSDLLTSMMAATTRRINVNQAHGREAEYPPFGYDKCFQPIALNFTGHSQREPACAECYTQ